MDVLGVALLGHPPCIGSERVVIARSSPDRLAGAGKMVALKARQMELFAEGHRGRFDSRKGAKARSATRSPRLRASA
jgi:hypothetical protein